ncbi:MAG: flagellar assembly peptidoglycan hydrolase FlgJ [Pseudomonadales bacterium]|nr:flagellar assembly peptidoglycan hydrolase FlgJ [Pseudomonadales bacterium]
MLGQAAAPVSAANYNDLSGLAQIKQLAGVNEGAAYEEIGKQFESLLLHVMLKGMRSANRVFSEGGLLSSNSVEFYENMLDDQLSLALAGNGGMGIAKEFSMQTRSVYGQAAVQTAQREAQLNSLPTRRVEKALSTLQVSLVSQAPQASPPSIVTAVPGLQSDAPLATLNRENFVERLMPLATRAAAKLDVEPELLLAQAALETGWGEQVIAHSNGNSSHNLFGIKAGGAWQGQTAEVKTHEYIQSRKVNVVASFRAYDTLQQSFEDYVAFIQNNPRYKNALAHRNSDATYPQLIQRAGYATDPDYATKIHAIASRIAERKPVQLTVASNTPAAANEIPGAQL